MASFAIADIELISGGTISGTASENITAGDVIIAGTSGVSIADCEDSLLNSSSGIALQDATAGDLVVYVQNNAKIRISNTLAAGQFVYLDGGANKGNLQLAGDITAGDKVFVIGYVTAADAEILLNLWNTTYTA